MNKGWDVLTAVGVVGSGLLGGVFFTFSTFVMSALRRLPARQGTVTMQSINVTAQHPPLMLALFGTAAACGVLIYRAVATWGEPRAGLLLAGAVLYLLGAVVVTAVVNIPLNNRLDRLSPDAADMPAQWQSFVHAWSIANHVRTVLCVAAAAVLAAALTRPAAGAPEPTGPAAAGGQAAAVIAA